MGRFPVQTSAPGPEEIPFQVSDGLRPRGGVILNFAIGKQNEDFVYLRVGTFQGLTACAAPGSVPGRVMSSIWNRANFVYFEH